MKIVVIDQYQLKMKRSTILKMIVLNWYWIKVRVEKIFIIKRWQDTEDNTDNLHKWVLDKDD